MSAIKLTMDEMRQYVQAGRAAVADLRSTGAQHGAIGEVIATATMQGGAGVAVHEAFVNNVAKMNNLANLTEEKLDGVERFIQATEEATAHGASAVRAVVSA